MSTTFSALADHRIENSIFPKPQRNRCRRVTLPTVLLPPFFFHCSGGAKLPLISSSLADPFAHLKQLEPQIPSPLPAKKNPSEQTALFSSSPLLLLMKPISDLPIADLVTDKRRRFTLPLTIFSGFGGKNPSPLADRHSHGASQQPSWICLI
ncbi:hypothetical protein ACLOJK_003298 [Asimina triloba]